MVPEVRRAADPPPLPPIAWPDELPLPLAAMPSPVSVSWPGSGYGNKAYTGREWDNETGLYYYRARYYDPKAGRFLSEDPLGLGGGDVNFYAYVKNNPVNYVDPDGLQCIIIGRIPPIFFDPTIIGGRQLPTTTRLPPSMTQPPNAPPGPRISPPRIPIPQPLPPPVLDPTPTQIVPRMPWWWKIVHPFTPWGGDPSVVPATPKDDCKCIA